MSTLPTIGGRGIMLSGRLSGHLSVSLSVNTYFTVCLTLDAISLYGTGGISMKLGINIHHVNGRC